MFSKIIVGSSLSEVSFKTLYCLKGLRQAEPQEVILVHAINIRGAGSLYRQLLKLADPLLEEQKKILEDMGFSVEIEVLLGSPHYEINRLAREKNVSLIAVHMTAESLIDDAFVGGVAYEVIQHAEKPVLGRLKCSVRTFSPTLFIPQTFQTMPKGLLPMSRNWSKAAVRK